MRSNFLLTFVSSLNWTPVRFLLFRIDSILRAHKKHYYVKTKKWRHIVLRVWTGGVNGLAELELKMEKITGHKNNDIRGNNNIPVFYVFELRCVTDKTKNHVCNQTDESSVKNKRLKRRPKRLPLHLCKSSKKLLLVLNNIIARSHLSIISSLSSSYFLTQIFLF